MIHRITPRQQECAMEREREISVAADVMWASHGADAIAIIDARLTQLFVDGDTTGFRFWIAVSNVMHEMQCGPAAPD
jgi:hypothetical protein